MILITGGSGFIGSHTVLKFLEADHKIVVIDNLSNSSFESLLRVEKITSKKVVFIKGDIRDESFIDRVFDDYDISSVIHFAGLKAVGESSKKPLEYYDNNINGTLVLLRSMDKAGVKKIVFSSSATVYGSPAYIPIDELCPVSKPTNPYGNSKLIIESILNDLYSADNSWSIVLLRYFNPVGAHESGMIGEDPNGTPNNLVPYISQVASGKLKHINIFGNSYNTPDGTGIRDYIHVMDLAQGHIAAYESMKNKTGVKTWNLGTGIGYSVFDVIKSFENACGKKLPYQIKDARNGDIAECWSECSKAYKDLSWKAERNLDDMMVDAWRWQSKNPSGYPKD